MQDPPTPPAAPGEPSPGLPPLPSRAHRPGSAGCLKILSIGCGGFFVVAMTAFALILLNFRAFVVTLEKNFVLGVVQRTDLRDSEKDIRQILELYDADSRKKKLGIAQWWAALTAFSRSPAALVLGILDARARLDLLAGREPEEKERAKRLLNRLAGGVAEGKISSADLLLLVERAHPAGGPEPGNPAAPADAQEVAEIDREEIIRFLPKAEKLLEERGAADPPAAIDLPGLLRRDLEASLAGEEAKSP
jgi:hypothetical protein